MTENANGIWQCPEVMTCQVNCLLHDTRKSDDEVEEFNVFYYLRPEDDWRRELSRICKALGFEECGVMGHWIRVSTLNSFTSHTAGIVRDGNTPHD